MVDVDERSVCVMASGRACQSAFIDVLCQTDERNVELHIDILVNDVTGIAKTSQATSE